jgi:hypothetical protein
MSSLVCNESLDESLLSKDKKSSSSGDLNFDGIRSIADPLLIRDERVLRNVLRLDEDFVGSNGIRSRSPVNQRRYKTANVNYFKTIQREIKPHMRKIVADWMLEVRHKICIHLSTF